MERALSIRDLVIVESTKENNRRQTESVKRKMMSDCCYDELMV